MSGANGATKMEAEPILSIALFFFKFSDGLYWKPAFLLCLVLPLSLVYIRPVFRVLLLN